MTKEQLIELVKFTAGEIVAPTTLNDEDAESIVDDFLYAEQLTIPIVSHSMRGEELNSLEFLEMIRGEWCNSEEQYKPFWNDLLTFARKYHKERKAYCG